MNMVSRTPEQKLIDIMFQMVLVATSDKKFCKRPRGERMAWVADHLREFGFDTEPIGMTWGTLITPEQREKIGEPLKDLDKWRQ